MGKVRHFPAALTRHAYWLAAALPLLLPAGWALRDAPGLSTAFAFVPLFVLYLVLPIADAWIGRDTSTPDTAQGAYPAGVVPVAAGVVYLAVLGWAVVLPTLAPDRFGAVALAGWVLSVGSVGGVVGINVAHELIHRRHPWLQRLGGLMLASVGYACFKLEHPRWHHVHVATPEDPSSAPRGSTVYGRVPGAWLHNTLRGFRLAAESARRAGRRWPALNHEMTGWYALTALLAAGLAIGFGALAAGIFVAQALLAAVLLEVVNYVEHYGLRRARRQDGRWEPPSTRHSWDSDYWLSNVLLLQLPRHADHHVHPSRPFTDLDLQADAPRLPLGYATLVVLAWVPPLYHRLIDPRIPPQPDA